MGEQAASRRERISAPVAALAGALAAGTALAAGELAGAATGRPPSLVTAVGDQFIDRFAGSLKDLAVALFGTNDKVALIVGIVVVSLALGAAGGMAARRRFWLAAAAFAAFGALGLWAGLRHPLAATGTVWLSVALAVSAGIGTLWLLLHVASRTTAAPTLRLPSRASEERQDAAQHGHVTEDPRRPHAPRRAFLGWSGAVGAWAALAAGGSLSLRGRQTVESERAATQLPEPARSTPLPSAGTFEIDDLEDHGLTPYIVPNEDFFRIDTALVVPQVQVASWRLRVDGMVNQPFELTYDELLEMDMVELPVTIACVSNEVGGNLIGNAVWQGVPLNHLLERAEVRPEGTQIVGESVDGFTAGFPTELALDGRTALVAVGMNGEPLPSRHGYPARLVVSGLYGYVSATKWLERIRLTGWDDFDGYWIPRGWSKEAPVKLSSRIDVPASGGIPPGRTPVAGVAWSPSIGIAAVAVRIDDGSWEPARLGETASNDTWVQWLYEWDATPGRHQIQVGAVDANGVAQDGEPRPPAPDGATGWHTRTIEVEET
jgi:DMSO/TMAO reductase YedYZ molybdopterin-dependent catalytic subunit